MRRHAALGAVLLGLLCAGCSVSFPIIGLSSKAEDEVATTSSVLPARGPDKAAGLGTLASELGPEDLRRADAAMSVALDPQGNGAAVSWDNPQSGIKGSFVPVGGPFLRRTRFAAPSSPACRPNPSPSSSRAPPADRPAVNGR